jgi:hypothetical protein
MNQAPLGATSAKYAAPAGAETIFGVRFYKDAAPLALKNRGDKVGERR